MRWPDGPPTRPTLHSRGLRDHRGSQGLSRHKTEPKFAGSAGPRHWVGARGRGHEAFSDRTHGGGSGGGWGWGGGGPRRRPRGGGKPLEPGGHGYRGERPPPP